MPYFMKATALSRKKKANNDWNHGGDWNGGNEWEQNDWSHARQQKQAQAGLNLNGDAFVIG